MMKNRTEAIQYTDKENKKRQLEFLPSIYEEQNKIVRQDTKPTIHS